ncbi:MAG: two-component regulator propeller domain-containing protein [Bacteroidota bacterium]|nr:two-component regulator propeller domain-containing protein [Bacteroidota bacterium]
MQRYILVFLLLISLFLTGARAQDIPHFVEKLTVREGLSSNKINDIAQDDNGFLWIATSDGLNRFDGTEVVQYFHQDNSNSLSHNYVYCLKKLPGNYIAIGTQAGLDFYNSNTGIFKNFYYTQNNRLDEFNNLISELETDTRGNLWAASSNCIFIFDTHLALKKVIPSPCTEADALRKRLRFVEKMLPLADGNMLLYLSTGLKVYSFETNTLTDLKNSSLINRLKFLNDLFNAPSVKKFEEYFPPAGVFKIFERYFLCIKPGADSLLLFNEQGEQLSSSYFPFNKYPYILWSQQLSIIDSTKLLFLFHNYGLASIAVTWEDGKPVIHTPSSLLFESYEYDAALRDRQGNWWLATTEQGLQKISPGKQYFKSDTLIDHLTGRPVKYDIMTIARNKNLLWIGTYGNGFFKVDPVSGKREQYYINTTPASPWPNFIWNIRQINEDTLWVGTQAGLFWYSVSQKKYGHLPAYPGKPSSLDSVPVTTQFVDSHGLVWMGLGKGKGLCYYDMKTRRFTYYPANTPDGYPLRYPTNIAEDRKGDLWLVNDASATLVYHKRNTEGFQSITLPVAAPNRLSNLSGILCEDDTTIWLGTVMNGLIKFNPATRSMTMYGHEKGLSNSHISSIYEDKEKRLWLVTNGDLSCFDKHTETFTNYSEKDGLPARYPTAAFYYDTLFKRLYTGGNGTLFYFDPDGINSNQAPQKTIITAIHVNGKPYMSMADESTASRFRSWQNDITIQYSVVDLTNGPGTKYTYKLIGEDTGWIMAGNQRQINFSRLAPGHYTFMVRASNSAGAWSPEIASIRFYIVPPFTKTIWFYALIVLGIGAVFYFMYRFRLRQLMRTEQIRSEISRNLHDEVGSSLTNISLSSLLAQKQLHNEGAVTRILERIYQDSQNVSEAMREIVWSINPKIDTMGEALPRMLRYASELLEAKDMELHAEIAPEIEQVKLTMQERRDLYLIFKEAVNNLAKHSKATKAVINFHVKDNRIIMEVSDNGVGFDITSSHLNNGLKNMRERARSHQWQLGMKSAPGAGATITLNAQIT